jgi:protein gp37
VAYAEVLDAKKRATMLREDVDQELRFARMRKAHDGIVQTAHELKGRAVVIEDAADRRLAEEYDAAQKRGEVGKEGRPKTVREGDGFSLTAADIGLTRQQIADARKHLHADKTEPGIVKRTVEDLLAKGEEPTKAKVEKVVEQAARQHRAQRRTKPTRETISLDEWNGWTPRERERLHEICAQSESKSVMTKQETSGIEWAQWSWNPITGCLHNCPYCYARDLAEERFDMYPHGFAPAFWPARLRAPEQTRVPEKAGTDERYRNVFTCSMADLFGRWVPDAWIEAVLDAMRRNPQWNFLCLSKFPKRMAEFDIPDNAWMGTTVDLQARVANAEAAFARLEGKPGIRWLSVEPMLEPLRFNRLDLFHWIVIGGASRSSKTLEFRPPFEWIFDLVAQAKDAGVRVYFKTNLLGNRMLQLPFDAPIVGDPIKAPDAFNYLGRIANARGRADTGSADS